MTCLKLLNFFLPPLSPPFAAEGILRPVHCALRGGSVGTVVMLAAARVEDGTRHRQAAPLRRAARQPRHHSPRRCLAPVSPPPHAAPLHARSAAWLEAARQSMPSGRESQHCMSRPKSHAAAGEGAHQIYTHCGGPSMQHCFRESHLHGRLPARVLAQMKQKVHTASNTKLHTYQQALRNEPGSSSPLSIRALRLGCGGAACIFLPRTRKRFAMHTNKRLLRQVSSGCRAKCQCQASGSQALASSYGREGGWASRFIWGEKKDLASRISLYFVPNRSVPVIPNSTTER